MRQIYIIVLFFFWMFLAYRAYENADMTMAAVFVAVGIAITAYRWRRSSS
jgi:hypothetical protein